RVLEFENLVAAQDLRRRSARNHRLDLATILGTATEIVDHFAHGQLADLDLEIPRILHVSGDTENPGAGMPCHSELRILIPTHADDVFHMAKRLDVVDDRRAHVETQRGREIRRLDPWIWALAFQ